MVRRRKFAGRPVGDLSTDLPLTVIRSTIKQEVKRRIVRHEMYFYSPPMQLQYFGDKAPMDECRKYMRQQRLDEKTVQRYVSWSNAPTMKMPPRKEESLGMMFLPVFRTKLGRKVVRLFARKLSELEKPMKLTWLYETKKAMMYLCSKSQNYCEFRGTRS